MCTTPPSTGAPSADQRFIFKAEASLAAASEKAGPSDSADSGAQADNVPSAPTVQRAMASGGNTRGGALASMPTSQTGVMTVRSASWAGGGMRIGTSTQSGDA